MKVKYQAKQPANRGNTFEQVHTLEKLMKKKGKLKQAMKEDKAHKQTLWKN